MIKQNKQFSAEVGQVLQLVIHSVYTNKEIFLRELISNASDACNKLKYQLLQRTENVSNALAEQFKITIKIDPKSEKIIITDNGIGMTDQDMVDNLGTIASSGTRKFIQQLNDQTSSPQLIGQFGVGFYSAFMVADFATVYSTKFGHNKTYIWESDGCGEYSISEHDVVLPRGTIVELKIRAKDVEFLEKHKIYHVIKTYSGHISFPIELIDEDGKAEIINTTSALWLRAPSEITQQQYIEFYRYVAHTSDEPWLTIHNKAEGNIMYTSLLFIPSTKPFDLFHHHPRSRVKLYVKRVFITDEGVCLIPQYLRFLRGIIDSDDLPLNISREVLQNNVMVNKIKKSVVKKVFSALRKKIEIEPEQFTTFWRNFGEVLKEGLCEAALEEKEILLGICHFYSLKSPDTLITLDWYIDNMRDGQDNIYYITGSSVETLRKSPQLEGFMQSDIDVLLLTDHVDDFWVNVVNQYKNKTLRSAVSSGIDFGEVSNAAPIERKQGNEQVDAENLVQYIKNVLGSRVRDVIISRKLVGSPACLVVPEGAMNIRMEKFLIEQKQLKNKTAKILEINLNHALIKEINNGVQNSQLSERVRSLVEIIFLEACIVEGEPIDDPYDFVQKLNTLLSSNEHIMG